MNTPHPPLSPETLDELLSADIDGELDRAATELGLTPAVARTAINTEDAIARRAALVAARDHLAVTPALDPERASQFVEAALAISAPGVPATAPTPLPRRAHRARSAWRLLAGAGAAAAVVAGIIVVTASSPGHNSQATSEKAAASAGTTTPSRHASPKPSTFGDVSTPEALRNAVANSLSKPANAAVATAQAPQAASFSPGTNPGRAYSSDKTAKTTTGGGARVPLQTCVDSIARTAHLAVSPAVTGRGTARGQPVFVIVYPNGSSHLVYVLSAADCSVISRGTLP